MRFASEIDDNGNDAKATAAKEQEQAMMDDNNPMMISRSDSSTSTPMLSEVSTSRNGDEPASVTKLPDSILQFIGGYLPNCSRAMMSFALSRLACFNSDIIDFGEIEYDFASKLTDDDIAGILLSINAKDTLKVLKLIGCDNISGIGLEPLRSSSVLEQIDLSTSDEVSSIATGADLFGPNFPWCFALSEDIIVPILDSIISKEEDKSLKHIQFPSFWRNATPKSDMLTAFMERYHVAQNGRTCFCTECKEGFQASEGTPWMNYKYNSRDDWGVQSYTCYACLSHFCDDCTIPFCIKCEKMFCGDCCTSEYCVSCDMVACNECDEFYRCDDCEEAFCSDCNQTNICECCNRTRCFDCAMHLECEGDCGSSNCGECAHADNVQWCNFCEREHCNDCRLKKYNEGNLDCRGCRGYLLPQIMQEKESLRGQLDAIKNGTSIHLSEAVLSS